VPTAYTIIFSEAAQVALLNMKRGKLVKSLIKHQLSVPHLTVMSVPLDGHPSLRLVLIAGYAVYFRFADSSEPNGRRYVHAVRLPGDVDV
jgi:hypothetical protein